MQTKKLTYEGVIDLPEEAKRLIFPDFVPGDEIRIFKALNEKGHLDLLENEEMLRSLILTEDRELLKELAKANLDTDVTRGKAIMELYHYKLKPEAFDRNYLEELLKSRKYRKILYLVEDYGPLRVFEELQTLGEARVYSRDSSNLSSNRLMKIKNSGSYNMWLMYLYPFAHPESTAEDYANFYEESIGYELRKAYPLFVTIYDLNKELGRQWLSRFVEMLFETSQGRELVQEILRAPKSGGRMESLIIEGIVSIPKYFFSFLTEDAFSEGYVYIEEILRELYEREITFDEKEYQILAYGLLKFVDMSDMGVWRGRFDEQLLCKILEISKDPGFDFREENKKFLKKIRKSDVCKENV